MLSEQYETERELKRSDRGTITLLRRKGSGERVVLRRFSGSAEAYRRLQELRCPHLPEIKACAEQDGQVLVLEEYIPGDALSFLLEAGPLTEAQATGIARQVCLALQALHGKGVVHRDVKPENILLDGDRAVLIDFDASRTRKPGTDGDTRVMGTTGYAAPEQYGFSQTDARADIYSLGILLNEMLTRRHPATRLAEGPLRPIIEKCIEVNVDKRYGSAAEVLAALQHPPARRPDRRRELSALISSLVILLAALIFLAGILLRPDRSTGVLVRGADTDSYSLAETIVQPELPPPDSAIQNVRLVQTDENQAYTSFTYDLNSDGQPEDYVFCVHSNIGGPGGPSPGGTDFANVPDGVIRSHSFAPAVLRAVPGGYEIAEEFAALLQEPRLELVTVGSLGSGSPEVTDADPLDGVWAGTRQVSYSAGCSGLWRYEASAVLDGQTLTARSVSAVNLDASSTLLSSASGEPDTFFEVAVPDAPVTDLRTVSDGENGLHHTEFSCDLDGDGQAETYSFRLGFSLNSYYPTPFTNDGRLMSSDSRTSHTFVPVVCVEKDGALETVGRFCDLLEDIELEIVCLRNPDGGEPSVSDAEPLAGWTGGKLVSYSADCRGQWKYEASAVFNGHTLTAAAVTTIQVDDSL